MPDFVSTVTKAGAGSTCSSLASQPPAELERILSIAREAGVVIVSLPLVNEWTQVNQPSLERQF